MIGFTEKIILRSIAFMPWRLEELFPNGGLFGTGFNMGV
jgi:hypothetical protein